MVLSILFTDVSENITRLRRPYAKECGYWKPLGRGLWHNTIHTSVNRVVTKTTNSWTLKTVKATKPFIRNALKWLLLTVCISNESCRMLMNKHQEVHMPASIGLQSAYKYLDYGRKVLRLTWHWMKQNTIPKPLKVLWKACYQISYVTPAWYQHKDFLFKHLWNMIGYMHQCIPPEVLWKIQYILSNSPVIITY